MAKIVDKPLAFFFLLISLPLWPILYLLVRSDSSGPFIFKQKRAGKNGSVFTIYKIRTMIAEAETLKKKYQHLNEADGPVFKIKNDPRFTRLGKILSHTGLNELPQLLNILKGEMSLVGPRPLPVDEEAKIPKKWQIPRRKSKPGLACSWLLAGSHSLKFSQWMELDLGDLERSSFLYDLDILFKVIILGLKLVRREIRISKKTTNTLGILD